MKQLALIVVIFGGKRISSIEDDANAEFTNVVTDVK